MTSSASSLPPPATIPRRVFPIYVKVMLLFFVNVLVVAGGAFWMLRTVFELDRDLLIDRNARERLQLLGATVGRELFESPRTSWDAILKKHGAENHAELSLYDAFGVVRAGAKNSPPERVNFFLTELARAGKPSPPPPEGDRERDREREREPRRVPHPGEPNEFDEGPPPRERERPPHPNFDRKEPIAPMKIEALADGGVYWFTVKLMPILEGRPPERSPFLVGKINGLGESALLFNPMPWLFAAGGVLLISALVWFPLVRSLTKSLGKMTEATSKIAEGNFDDRVDDSRRDELGQLGSAINAMSERLGGFVSGQKRFLGDIAHELCSPLVRMEMALGILEQKAPEELTGRLVDVREEVREMSELVSELLSFSKAGFQSISPSRENITLSAVVENAIAREAANEEVKVELPQGVEVVAAPAMLSRAIGNLLRNAVRYAAHCGPIEITAHQQGKHVEITISDHGPGVPEEDLPRLFDPFFRSDPSRTRETGGTGLGLAIVKSCVEACGGKVVAENHPNGGFMVTLSLEAAN